jgi:hypothetical protein
MTWMFYWTSSERHVQFFRCTAGNQLRANAQNKKEEIEA